MQGLHVCGDANISDQISPRINRVKFQSVGFCFSEIISVPLDRNVIAVYTNVITVGINVFPTGKYHHCRRKLHHQKLKCVVNDDVTKCCQLTNTHNKRSEMNYHSNTYLHTLFPITLCLLLKVEIMSMFF